MFLTLRKTKVYSLSKTIHRGVSFALILLSYDDKKLGSLLFSCIFDFKTLNIANLISYF